MRFIPGVIALILTGYFSVRGAETFNLVPMAGGVWAAALVLMILLSRRSKTNRDFLRGWAVFGVLWVVAASIVFTSWPLRIGPIIYRKQFEELAAKIRSGQTFTARQRIGPFQIERGEIDRGFVCLWLDLDTNGRSGFIRSITGQKMPFNKWSLTAAGAGWQFLVED